MNKRRKDRALKSLYDFGTILNIKYLFRKGEGKKPLTPGLFFSTWSRLTDMVLYSIPYYNGVLLVEVYIDA